MGEQKKFIEIQERNLSQDWMVSFDLSIENIQSEEASFLEIISSSLQPIGQEQKPNHLTHPLYPLSSWNIHQVNVKPMCSYSTKNILLKGALPHQTDRAYVKLQRSIVRKKRREEIDSDQETEGRCQIRRMLQMLDVSDHQSPSTGNYLNGLR